jgi:hypothetical protein
MLLADFAQVSGGKLYVIGGGWSITGPAPTQMSIALKLEVPWDRANHKFPMRLELQTEDGGLAQVRTAFGGQETTVVVEGEFEAGRPAGLKQGTPLDVAMAINIPPMQLSPGARYVWKLFIDGDTQEEWALSFSTRPQKPSIPD